MKFSKRPWLNLCWVTGVHVGAEADVRLVARMASAADGPLGGADPGIKAVEANTARKGIARRPRMGAP